MKKYFIIFFIATLELISQTSEGKKFWFGFMKNHHDSIPELSVYISSSKNTSGTLQIPKQKFIKEFKVTADSAIKITLPSRFVQNNTTDIISLNGIFIESDDDINVFALNYIKHTSDASIIYPIEVLGTKYTCSSYNGNTVLLIVGTKDGTIVDIYPTNETYEGVKRKITKEINSGETYQLIQNGDLSGTRVISRNNPIAVFSGDVCSFVPKEVPACDHLFEQMIPDHAWGYEYATIPLMTRRADTYKIMSLQDNSPILINDNYLTTLNSRETYEVILSEPSIIRSKNPILVFQYSNGQDFDSTNSDPFVIRLSPINQRRNNITFNAFKSDIIEKYYLNILINKKDIHKLFIDSINIYDDYDYLSFKTDDELVSFQIPISQGNHTLKSKGEGFIAYVYGYGNYESYGYNAGNRIEKLNEFKIRFGFNGGYSFLTENPRFINFEDIPTCYRNLFEICDNNSFSLFNENVYNFGTLLEIPSLLKTPFGIGGRASLNYMNVNFHKTEYFNENNIHERKLNNSAQIDIYSLNLYPYLIFTFFDKLNLYAGINWTFNFLVNSNYEEFIEESNFEDKYSLVYSNRSDFFDKRYQQIGGVVGLSFDLVLNEKRNKRISPEVFYFHNLISSSNDISFYLNRLQVGFSFKFGY